MRWYLWRIVGCEGRSESSGTQTRQSRNQWPTSGEADGTTAAGTGEAIHCWAPSQRWPHCWTWSLSIYIGCFCTCIIPFSFILSYFLARISSFVIIDFLVCKGYCYVLFLSQIPDHERWCCIIYLSFEHRVCKKSTFFLNGSNANGACLFATQFAISVPFFFFYK